MVQKRTPETQFFHAMNENNHLQTAAVTDDEEDSHSGPEAAMDSPAVQSTDNLEALADFKRILLRNYERILSKNWDFLSQREVRELTGREQEQIFEAWKQQGLIDDASNVEKRRAIELIRSEFLRLKNFARVRKMLVLIKNSLFWKMRRFNGNSRHPLRVSRQINWRDLPKTPLVRNFLRSLIKFRDFLRDGKMDHEKVQSLDLVLTERQENAFIVRFMLLNEAYMRQFMNVSKEGVAAASAEDHTSRWRSFRALNSFYIQEQLQLLQMMRQQKKEAGGGGGENKVLGAFPDAQLLDEFRKVEKDEWFGVDDDIRADEITDHGLLGGSDHGGAGGSGEGNGLNDGDGGYGDGGSGSGDDNLFLYQLVRNNTTLRLFIYLSVVLCVVLIVVAIVLLKLYHGSMFKVRGRSRRGGGGAVGGGDQQGSSHINGGVVVVGGSSNSSNEVGGGYEMSAVGGVTRASMRCPQQPLPSIPPSSNASSDAPMIELSRGSSLRRSLVMMGGGGVGGNNMVAETDFSLGGGGFDEFQLKRMYNGRASFGGNVMMIGSGSAGRGGGGGGTDGSGGSLGMKQKRKRKLATDWPPPPTTMGATGFDEYPTMLMGGGGGGGIGHEGEMELERSRRPLDNHQEDALLGLDGRMMGYPPPPIFVNQHHHHLHHHLHTHTHYGPGGAMAVAAGGGLVEPPQAMGGAMAVPRQKGGLYQG